MSQHAQPASGPSKKDPPPSEPQMSSAGRSSKGKEREQNPQTNQNVNSAAREIIEILGEADQSEDEAEDAEQGQNSNAPSTPTNRIESNDSEVKRAYERCGLKLNGWTVDDQRKEISVINSLSPRGSSSCFISNSGDLYFNRPLVWKKATTSSLLLEPLLCASSSSEQNQRRISPCS